MALYLGTHKVAKNHQLRTVRKKCYMSSVEVQVDTKLTCMCSAL